MEPLILTEKRKSQRIPVELTVLAELEERRIAMCSDNISLDGMFLFSREFVRPCAVFPASVWISNEQEPLQVYLTSCFTERTWTGYGIGASISGISASDLSRWDEFYRSCGAARSEQVRQALQAERTVRDRRIVVVDGALSLLAVQGLRKQGLEISHVASAAQALEQIQRELGLTFIHVTHSQEEAMALADLVVVMNHGRIEQQGTPHAVFNAPRSEFVARFMGGHNVIPRAQGLVAVRADVTGTVFSGDRILAVSPMKRTPETTSVVAAWSRPKRAISSESLTMPPVSTARSCRSGCT